MSAKSEKSYNSESGVPLTVIGAKTGWDSLKQWLAIILRGLKIFLRSDNYPKFLVLEIGGGPVPKDMEKMVSWVKPDVVVITAVGTIPVHVQYFQRTGRIDKREKKAGGMFKRQYSGYFKH